MSKYDLVNEMTSPLHRLMWVYNSDLPDRRSFENNICAFHIGNGYLLSVAHNLRIPAGVLKSIDEDIYRKELLLKLDGSQKNLMDQCYFVDAYTNRRHLNTADTNQLQAIAAIFKQKRFDTRWQTLAAKKICDPHLILQFRTDKLYGRTDLTQLFDPKKIVFEKESHRYSFPVSVELVDAFYEYDIALYRIVNTHEAIINAIPSVQLSFDRLDTFGGELNCLQSAPSSIAGRLLNVAHLEGILDNFNLFHDEIGGNYILEGLRYLIKGYFRFGSSGAPYLYYDAATGQLKANAIQSEASGIQFSNKHDLEGNIQYTNAIATPLYNVREALAPYIG